MTAAIDKIITKESLAGGEFIIKDAKPASTYIPEAMTEDQQMIADMVEDFVGTEVLPNMQKIEKQEGLSIHRTSTKEDEPNGTQSTTSMGDPTKASMGDPNKETEQVPVEDVPTSEKSRKFEYNELESEISKYEQMLKEKLDRIRSLQRQLKEVDTSLE